jgi:hypothetical protein
MGLIVLAALIALYAPLRKYVPNLMMAIFYSGFVGRVLVRCNLLPQDIYAKEITKDQEAMIVFFLLSMATSVIIAIAWDLDNHHKNRNRNDLWLD